MDAVKLEGIQQQFEAELIQRFENMTDHHQASRPGYGYLAGSRLSSADIRQAVVAASNKRPPGPTLQ